MVLCQGTHPEPSYPHAKTSKEGSIFLGTIHFIRAFQEVVCVHQNASNSFEAIKIRVYLVMKALITEISIIRKWDGKIKNSCEFFESILPALAVRPTR